MNPALIVLNVLLVGSLVGAVVLLGLHRRASRPKTRPIDATRGQPVIDVPVAAASADEQGDAEVDPVVETIDADGEAAPSLAALASSIGGETHAPGDALNLVFADAGTGDAARRTLGALTGIGFGARWGLEHELLLARPSVQPRRRRKAKGTGEGDLVRMIVGRANDRDAQVTLDVLSGNPQALATQVRGELRQAGAEFQSAIIDHPEGAVELSIVRRAPFYFSAAS